MATHDYMSHGKTECGSRMLWPENWDARHSITSPLQLQPLSMPLVSPWNHFKGLGGASDRVPVVFIDCHEPCGSRYSYTARAPAMLTRVPPASGKVTSRPVVQMQERGRAAAGVRGQDSDDSSSSVCGSSVAHASRWRSSTVPTSHAGLRSSTVLRGLERAIRRFELAVEAMAAALRSTIQPGDQRGEAPDLLGGR